MIITSLLVSTTKVIAEPLEIVDTPIEYQIAYFSASYGGDSNLILSVMQCESQGNHKAIGDGGRSNGIFQFQKPTFLSLEKKFGQDLNYESQFDQMKLATWAISNGYGNNWTAYRAIKNGGKYSFYSSQMGRHYTVYCKLLV